MKIALLMNSNAYPGREYLQKINEAGIRTDIISFGNHPEVDKVEEERCGGLWKSEKMCLLTKGLYAYCFSSLSDPFFINHLSAMKYDLGIQGGTGILKTGVIQEFRLGILNFHPGDLPLYRGCSAPEWQMLHGLGIVSTCHLVDEGVDSGMIYKKKILQVNYKNYHTVRATVYPETAKFVVEVLFEILQNENFVSEVYPQNESLAVYRQKMKHEDLEIVKENMNSKRGLT